MRDCQVDNHEKLRDKLQENSRAYSSLAGCEVMLIVIITVRQTAPTDYFVKSVPALN